MTDEYDRMKQAKDAISARLTTQISDGLKEITATLEAASDLAGERHDDVIAAAHDRLATAQAAQREQTAATLLAALIDNDISKRGGPLTDGERLRVEHAVRLTDALRAALGEAP